MHVARNTIYTFADGSSFNASEDGGKTWTRKPVPPGYISSMANIGNTLYAIIRKDLDSLYKYVNKGKTWTGLKPGGHLSDLKVVGNTLYVSEMTNMGVTKSAGGGATFTPANNGLEGNQVSRLASNGSVLYAVAGVYVYRSEDAGANWAKTSGAAGYSIYASGNNVYIGRENSIGVSADKGNSWKEISMVGPFAWESYGSFVFGGNSSFGNLSESNDNGVNWFLNDETFGKNNAISRLAVYKSSLLIGTQNQGIYIRSMPTPPSVSEINDVKICKNSTNDVIVQFTVKDSITPVRDLAFDVLNDYSLCSNKPVPGGDNSVKSLTLTPISEMQGTSAIEILVMNYDHLITKKSFTFVINDVPAVPVISKLGADSIICSAEGSIYEWKLGNVMLAENTRKIKAKDGGEYSVTIIHTNGCRSDASQVFEFKTGVATGIDRTLSEKSAGMAVSESGCRTYYY